MNRNYFEQNSKLTNLPSHYRFLASCDMINSAVNKCATDIVNYFIINKINDTEIVLVGILNGAIMFLTDLVRILRNKLDEENLKITIQIQFVNIKSYDNMIKKNSQIHFDFDHNKLKNKHVILIDELIDTGDTLLNLCRTFNDLGINNLYTCTVFLKNRLRSLNPTWYGMLVPDLWLIGYGLDDMGINREINTLCFVKKPDNIPKSMDDIMFEKDDYFDAWSEYFNNLNYHHTIDF